MTKGKGLQQALGLSPELCSASCGSGGRALVPAEPVPAALSQPAPWAVPGARCLCQQPGPRGSSAADSAVPQPPVPAGTRMCWLLPALAAVAQVPDKVPRALLLIPSHPGLCLPSLMLWCGFSDGAALGEPRLLSQGEMPPGELPGRLEYLGPHGMWLNPGRSWLFFCCHLCPE